MNHRNRILMVGTALCAMTITHSAMAQTMPTPPQTESTAVEDIVVTARRRDEALQDVPIAITAFSGEDLRQQAIATTGDLQFHTPALQIVATTYGPSVPSFTIRSQHQLEAIITQDPSVGVYLDDFVQVRPHGTNSALFDLESVQVLKGPQGTLFGRNTTGGAVLISTSKPSLDGVEGEVSLRAGDYGAVGGTGVLNLPLSDVFALRLGANIETHDGYSINTLTGQDLDDQNSYSWRVSALFQPNDVFRNILVFNSFQDNSNGAAQRVVASRVASQTPSLTAYATGDFHNFQSNLTPRYAKSRATNIINTTTLDLTGNLSLKNIVGYRKVYANTSEDTDGSSVSLFESFYRLDADQFSEELQLLGTSFEGSLNWIVGGYYFKETGNDRQDSVLFGLRHSEADAENVSYSIFGQATYDFKSVPGLSVTAGIRQTWDERQITARNATNGVCRILTANIGGVPISPCEKTASASFDQPTWTLTVDYKVTDKVLVYGGFRRGYRSGGFNLRAGIPAEFVPFRPETVNDYEVGLKADWSIGGSALRTNLAVYHDDYKDVQRSNSFIDPTVNAFTTVAFNAQQATIDGVEFDATWLPVDGLELRGYVSYSDASYDEWVLPTGADFTNNEFSYAPRMSGGASARYTWALPNAFGDLSAQVDWYSQARMQLTDVNEPQGVIPGYDLWNARVDWQGVGGHPIDASITVKNLLDTDYASAGNTVYTSVGFTSIMMGAPRTVLAEVRYSF